MKISLENLHVDIGAEQIKPYPRPLDQYANSHHCFPIFPMVLTRRICLTIKTFNSLHHEGLKSNSFWDNCKI